MNKKIIFIIFLPFILIAATLAGFFLAHPSPKIDQLQNNINNEIIVDIPNEKEPTTKPNEDTNSILIFNNGKNAVEYNNKIYFNNYAINNPYSNVTVCSTDLNGKNQKKLIENDYLENVNIYNDTIYTKNQLFNLSNNKVTSNDLPITYIDETITIYTDDRISKNYVLDTSANIYGKDPIILNFQGKFIDKIDNKIYFYKLGTSMLYLCYSNINTFETICIDTVKYDDIYKDYYDEYFEYKFVISDIEHLNNTVLYNIGSYQGSGSFWYGYITKVNSDGSNKKIIASTDFDSCFYKDSNYLYYYAGSMESSSWYKYSPLSDSTAKMNYNVENLLNPVKKYNIEKINNKLYLTTLNSDNKTYSKAFKLTDNSENFSSLYDIIIFDDYLIAYLEYRDFNESGWRGIPSMYIYYIKKDGSEIFLLNN